jgi:hypothetical protein
MQHVVHVLYSAVESYVDGRQQDSPCAAEDQETHACSLSSGPPLVRFLEVLEGIDGEAHLGDRQGEYDTEEDTGICKPGA